MKGDANRHAFVLALSIGDFCSLVVLKESTGLGESGVRLAFGAATLRRGQSCLLTISGVGSHGLVCACQSSLF